jgi:hypothetical protein
MNINNKYIYTNSNLLDKLIKYIINKSSKKKINNKCNICYKKFNFIYIYIYKNKIIKISELNIHYLLSHNIINTNLYKQLTTIKLKDYDIRWCLLATNQINILDSLYENGSNKIYIEKNKNISQSKINRF